MHRCFVVTSTPNVHAFSGISLIYPDATERKMMKGHKGVGFRQAFQAICNWNSFDSVFTMNYRELPTKYLATFQSHSSNKPDSNQFIPEFARNIACMENLPLG